MRELALIAVLLSLAASPAWCDGVVATAPGPDVTPTMPVAVAPGPLGSDFDDADAGAPGASGCALNPIARGGPTSAADNGVHGQVDVGVGTNGYRHVGLYACKPFANGGSVAVSVSQSQANWGGRR